MYEGFATVYDEVMSHIPYDEWFNKIKGYLEDKGVTSGTMCELGCGTGIMTELFAGAGFDMIGVDKSENMLALANAKKEETKSGTLYIHQSMEELELDREVDVFISVCDSINYLLQESMLFDTFSRVCEYLKPGGYFIFDLKTVYCYRNIIGNQTWVEQDEDVSYIWENYFYEDQDVNEYMMTLFKRQPDTNLYEKIEEAHYQKAYGIDDLKKVLEQAGLWIENTYDEDFENPPSQQSERVYIIAKKPE